MEVKLTKELKRQLFNDYKTYIYRTALLLTHSKPLADDVVQETFIRVFNKYHTYNNEKPIKPWIYKITINVVRNILRKQKWLSYVGQMPEEKNFESPEDKYYENEVKSELRKEINKLSLKSREVIILHFYNQFTLKEVSDILDIPLGTCKSRLNTGLKGLRKQLNGNDLFQTYMRSDSIETI
ncbi:RNA polymerase sigma factor [Neobacillus sp. YIM B06451]|uniref:RNA polymerase sigma factor n=1 Tax=Neobacillus sp. YIM B06451 TaxID=3070994 RepID=UPI00292DCF11|nr:RNA polymerase sigma factor [Neobacillus sp. YIM B06451]